MRRWLEAVGWASLTIAGGLFELTPEDRVEFFGERIMRFMPTPPSSGGASLRPGTSRAPTSSFRPPSADLVLPDSVERARAALFTRPRSSECDRASTTRSSPSGTCCSSRRWPKRRARPPTAVWLEAAVGARPSSSWPTCAIATVAGRRSWQSESATTPPSGLRRPTMPRWWMLSFASPRPPARPDWIVAARDGRRTAFELFWDDEPRRCLHHRERRRDTGHPTEGSARQRHAFGEQPGRQRSVAPVGADR